MRREPPQSTFAQGSDAPHQCSPAGRGDAPPASASQALRLGRVATRAAAGNDAVTLDLKEYRARRALFKLLTSSR